MLTMNLNTGMTSMEKRLGADLMVVPQNTVQKAEALLTNGNPSTFYFTKDIVDEVMQARRHRTGHRTDLYIIAGRRLLCRKAADHRLRPGH